MVGCSQAALKAVDRRSLGVLSGAHGYHLVQGTGSRAVVAPYMCLSEDTSAAATWPKGVLLHESVFLFPSLGHAG